MNRIAIIGVAGSGKSTFANKLGKKLNRPVIHLDKEYWTSDWKKKYSSREAWNNLITEWVKHDSWIIDGNYSSSLDIRLNRADTIIFFDLPKWQCLWRAFVRIFNQKQPFDKPEGMKERISWELIKFILEYNKKEARTIVEKYRHGRHVFTVHNNREIDQLLNKFPI